MGLRPSTGKGKGKRRQEKSNEELELPKSDNSENDVEKSNGN